MYSGVAVFVGVVTAVTSAITGALVSVVVVVSVVVELLDFESFLEQEIMERLNNEIKIMNKTFFKTFNCNEAEKII